jgi:ssDNA-binding replication factor A large subunit
MQVADASGTTFMTIWVRRPYQNAKTGKETPVVPLPLVEEGQSYEFKNVVTNEFPAGSGRISLQSNSKSTEIVPFEEEIEVKVGEQEIVAPIVAIFDDSGLIKKCTVMVEDDKAKDGFRKCGRNYIKGECPVKEHGKQKSEYDIMVRGVLDDGYHTQSFVLNAELTKKLTGIDVDTAKALVVDNAETPSIVADTIREKLMNRYFHVKGFVTAGGRMIVKEISTPSVDTVDMTALKAKLEAI